MADKPRLVVHSHYGSRNNIDGAGDDITWRIHGTNGKYFRSTKSPYSGMSFSLKCAFEEINTFISVGDWLVFYDPIGRPYSFDYVTNVQYGVAQNKSNGTVSVSCDVTASSWMELLGLAEIYVPMGDVGPGSQRGTIMTLQQWDELNFGHAQETFKGNVGKALAYFHKRAAKIRLPESLGGEFLGDAIPVVHDEETAGMYAQGRVVDSVSVGGGLPQSFMFNFYTSKISEIYNAMFVPEPMLIELYPSLEPIESGTEPLSKLARAINARPVLMYTLPPFRAEPLANAVFVYQDFKGTDDIVNNAARRMFVEAGSLLHPGVQTLDTQAEFQRLSLAARTNAAVQAYVLTTMFTKTTWDPSKAVEIPLKAWKNFGLGYADASRVNVGSINIATGVGTGIEAMSKAGLPIVNIQSVENHGVRLAKPSWPYMIPGPQLKQPQQDQQQLSGVPSINQALQVNRARPASVATWTAYMRAIAAQIIQFYGNAHKLGSGVLNLVPPDAIVQDESSGVAPPRLPWKGQQHRYIDINCGQAFRLPIRKGISDFLGYADTISHSFSINKDNGTISMEASINYSRGVSKSDKATQFGKVPVTGVEPPAATGGNILTSGGTVPLAPSMNSPAGCSEGAPYSAFPSGLDLVVVENIPSWLKPWASSRGVVFPASAAGDVLKRIYVTAAVAYIIEMYWTQNNALGQILVISGYRTVGEDSINHSSGSSIDFSVAKAGGRHGVLQTWAALTRLSVAKRIPVGGRGLYINFGSGGLTGTDPSQAGAASKADSRYPAGGSSGVHYDFRGTFGKAGPATTWIAADTNGDGHDEYTLSATDRRILTEFLPSRSPPVLAYFNSLGVTDQSLPAVGNTVPNVMQVLGITSSCFSGGGNAVS